jgi:hypothetical protein
MKENRKHFDTSVSATAGVGCDKCPTHFCRACDIFNRHVNLLSYTNITAKRVQVTGFI